jgi:signal transduction histidine kinase
MGSTKLFSFVSLFIIILFTPLSLLHAQADSLLAVYQTAKTPDDKLWAMEKLSTFYLYSTDNLVQAERYSKMLLADATKYANSQEAIRAYLMLGYVKQIANKPANSFEPFEKGLALAQQTHNDEFISIILHAIGVSHNDLGNVSAYYEYLEKSLEAAQKCDCASAKTTVMGSLGNFYTNKLKDKEKGLFWRKECDKYTSYLSDGNTSLTGFIKCDIAESFLKKGQIDSAKIYNAMALDHLGEIKDINLRVYHSSLESTIALLQHNLQKALTEAQKAYALAQSMEQPGMRLLALNPLVTALLAMKRADEVQKYLSETETVLNQASSLIALGENAETAYDNLFKAYLTKDPQRAAYFLEKQKALQDTINQSIIETRAAVFAAQNGLALKESENKRLKLEEEKNQERNRFLLISLVLATLTVFSLAYLYRRIRHKNETLKGLNAALTQSNTQMEYFTHTLSHDALGYINHILNYATEGQEADKVEEGHYAASKIHHYATNLKKMAQNLIQFNNTGLITHQETVVVADLVAEVAQDMNGDLAANKVTLNSLTATTTVHTNREFLKQVLRNLMHNAVKFHRPDVPPVLTIKAIEKEDTIEVSVADNGIGIPPEQLHLVFNEFTKLDKQTDGSGLGLFISKQIIERMSGKIWVESKAGQGSIFYFTLPQTSPSKTIPDFGSV